MDMVYAFLKHYYGKDDDDLSTVMNNIEYAPHTDPHWDPFSVVHKACHPAIFFLSLCFNARQFTGSGGRCKPLSL